MTPGTNPVVRIPTLADWGLDVVPDWDPNDPTWNQRWFAWRDALGPVRAHIHALCHPSHPNHAINRQIELQLCAADPARWLAIWGTIEEPRKRRGESSAKPFTPFAFQVRILQWSDWLMNLDEAEVADGFISKCRGLGASWIVCAYVLHGWLFKNPWDVLMLSRKEALVDKPKHKQSLFYKIDYLLNRLPDWMRPAGYHDGNPWRLNMNMTNPVTGAVIMGESTTEKSGRGGRGTLVVYDEAAFMPSFNDVFSTGTEVADVRIVISTESFEEGMDFHNTVKEQRKLNPDRVLDLDWWLNPYQDQEWFENRRDRMAATPEKFAQEYLRDPWAAYGSLIYPSIRDKTCDAPGYIEGQPILAGIDPGFADDTAIVWVQVQSDGMYRVIDSFEDHLQPAEYYAHLLTGIPPVAGDKCYGIQFSARARQIMEWTRTLPWSERVRYVMDPSGAQKDMSGLSFYERLVRESKRLREREADRIKDETGEAVMPQALRVYYKDLFAQNKHHVRHLAARNLLLRTVVADTPGAKAWYEAMRSYRYTEPGPKASGEPKPIHDESSHLASAYEYLANYAELGFGATRTNPDGTPRKRTSNRVPPAKRTPALPRIAA